MVKYLLLLLIIFATKATCQDALSLTQISKHRFSDGVKEGPLHKFEHVFAENERDLKNFKKFNRTRKSQRIVNYSFLGISAFGTIMDYTTSDDGCIHVCNGGVALAVTISSGLLMIITNSILGPIKLKRKKRLLKESPNFYKVDKLGNIDLKINIEQHATGIGLVVHF